MILVTVGSGKFDALVRYMDGLAPLLGEEVVVQVGWGDYMPRNCKWFRFKPSLKNEFKQASLVVSHEGAGTLLELLQLRKRVVVVANPETVNNPDIAKKMSSENLLVFCSDVDFIGESIAFARNARFDRYVRPSCRIAQEIQRFLK